MHLTLKIVPTAITQMLIDAASVTCQNGDIPNDYCTRIAESYQFRTVLVDETKG